MRRSFVRLVVSSVLGCWTLGLAVTLFYGGSVRWTEDKARTAGVFLVYEILDALPRAERRARLVELRPHFSVPFQLVSAKAMERRVGRGGRSGEMTPYRDSLREHWLYSPFSDGEQALAAGPVNPAVPTGVVPIGIILAIVGLPLIAGMVALQVERQLTKVEEASQALAEGEFGARVDNPHGPSNELAATFNAMAERVERLIRSRDELVQAVSHELGSPLSRLRFHVELLEEAADEQREDRLNAMTRELDALEDLVAELLSYVQSDELKLDRRVFSPQQILTDLVELARLEYPEERNVTLAVDGSAGASVAADPRLFQRALENTLRNAMQHARERVRVNLVIDDHCAHVVVHDDGVGIPQSLREKVMSPFVRLEADRGRKTGGVGLGLAIVSRIMERHGGRVTIESSPLGGAAVATSWPHAGHAEVAISAAVPVVPSEN